MTTQVIVLQNGSVPARVRLSSAEGERIPICPLSGLVDDTTRSGEPVP